MTLKYFKTVLRVNYSRSISTSIIKRVKPSVEAKEIHKTALYDFHVANNGKMVNFGGYLLPVQYGNQSISDSHKHTRKYASIFDVSHMLQTYIRGKGAIECIEQICTGNIRGLPNNTGTLTVFTNDKGGILDDLIVTKVSDDLLYIVSNAARKEHDSQLMFETVKNFQRVGKDITIEFCDPLQQGLIAVQGPEAFNVVQHLCSIDLCQLYFMNTTTATIAGVPNCRITRCGYTGEDGVEISVPADKCVHLTESLLNVKGFSIKLAGLGARDSLRLEAGLCLYGSDIDETTTPIEANLAWLVAKRRRTEKNFYGWNVILHQLANGTNRRRIGIEMTSGGPPARHGCKMLVDNEVVGEITSGCPSPSLNKNVAMGYISDRFSKIGTQVDLKIRDKIYPGIVSKMPFVTTHYHIRPKK